MKTNIGDWMVRKFFYLFVNLGMSEPMKTVIHTEEMPYQSFSEALAQSRLKTPNTITS